MTTLQLVYLVLVFFAFTGFAYVMMKFLTQRQTQVRLHQVAADNAEISSKGFGVWEETVNKIASPFVSLSLPSEGWENSALRVRFMHAGYRAQSVPLFYFGIKSLLALVLPGIFFLYVGISRFDLEFISAIWFLLLLASIGYYLPNLILARIIALRQRDLFENFPDAIDLMTVCVEAGLGLDAAMNKVGEEMRVKCQPLAEELHLVNLEMRAGRSRDQALRNLALRTGVEDIEGLVTMLIQADRFGTSIAASLRVHSDMLRTKRRQRAEEAAAKIALKLLFPLIFFIFPSLLLVLLGPAFIQIYRILLPTLAGQ